MRTNECHSPISCGGCPLCIQGEGWCVTHNEYYVKSLLMRIIHGLPAYSNAYVNNHMERDHIS